MLLASSSTLPATTKTVLPPPSAFLPPHLCSIGRAAVHGISCAVGAGGTPLKQQQPLLFRLPAKTSRRASRLVRASPSNSESNSNTSDVRVFLQTIQASGHSGNAVVFLSLQGSTTMVLPVHIGEHESRALQMEISNSNRIRPLTHDVTKNIIGALGYAITRIVITDIVQNTYYARVYMARVDARGKTLGEEVDVDARPSDAINFAIRAGAPMYVSEKVAQTAIEPEKVLSDFAAAILSPIAQTDIERSVRETLARFEDPCIMLQLHMDLAVQEQRFEDANALKSRLTDLKLHSQPLRLVVAMEAALADARFEEAARLRDEYLVLAEQQHRQQEDEESKQHGVSSEFKQKK